MNGDWETGVRTTFAALANLPAALTWCFNLLPIHVHAVCLSIIYSYGWDASIEPVLAVAARFACGRSATRKFSHSPTWNN